MPCTGHPVHVLLFLRLIQSNLFAVDENLIKLHAPFAHESKNSNINGRVYISSLAVLFVGGLIYIHWHWPLST
jgi:hypothetical protein